MSKTMNQVASGLYKAISEADKRKPKPYDTKAEVKRVEGNTAWVIIPGSTQETPVQKTNNANPGDTVMVRVSGGRAWLLGNNTSPATDDTQANAATQLAVGAGNLAEVAAKAASDAQESAGIAYSYADQAKTSADTANRSAKTAKESADSAIYGLSLVEDVVGTLNWISQHGIYVACTETSVIDGKTYYALTGNVITNPTGNPSSNGYYELIEEKYVLSTDTEVDSQKTYYQVIASIIVDPEGNPSTNPYYKLNINEAVTQYINTHLSLTERGLSIIGDTSLSSRLLLSNGFFELTKDVIVDLTKSYYIYDKPTNKYIKVLNPVVEEIENYYEQIISPGLTIYGSSGKKLGVYGDNAQIGDEYGFHIKITTGEEARMSFMYATTEVAYMSGDQLFIPKAVVVNSMQIGNEDCGWDWRIQPTESLIAGNLTLYWIGA